jgi:hypothetical protein
MRIGEGQPVDVAACEATPFWPLGVYFGLAVCIPLGMVVVSYMGMGDILQL